MQVELAIVYRPSDGRAVSVAKIKDADLLVAAAQAAVREAHDQAAVLSETDGVLSSIQAEEAEKLYRTLAVLIPALRDASGVQVTTH